MTHSEYGMCSV